jgi:hypothetical protein
LTMMYSILSVHFSVTDPEFDGTRLDFATFWLWITHGNIEAFSLILICAKNE